MKPAQVLELLALEAIEVDIFRAGGIPGQAARLYGGQVAAPARVRPIERPATEAIPSPNGFPSLSHSAATT
ncbi:MAG: hypothetical protein JWM19_6365 [Actinomycetia bacterium]|nr:hypothetical protein [Actinomycetes bacterium]